MGTQNSPYMSNFRKLYLGGFWPKLKGFESQCDATNAPNTASDIEEEDTEVVVEQKYIIRVKDDTIDNNEVRDDGGR